MKWKQIIDDCARRGWIVGFHPGSDGSGKLARVTINTRSAHGITVQPAVADTWKQALTAAYHATREATGDPVSAEQIPDVPPETDPVDSFMLATVIAVSSISSRVGGPPELDLVVRSMRRALGEHRRRVDR